MYCVAQAWHPDLNVEEDFDGEGDRGCVCGRKLTTFASLDFAPDNAAIDPSSLSTAD